jgi:hypothetical protein
MQSRNNAILRFFVDNSVFSLLILIYYNLFNIYLCFVRIFFLYCRNFHWNENRLFFGLFV